MHQKSSQLARTHSHARPQRSALPAIEIELSSWLRWRTECRKPDREPHSNRQAKRVVDEGQGLYPVPEGLRVGNRIAAKGSSLTCRMAEAVSCSGNCPRLVEAQL